MSKSYTNHTDDQKSQELESAKDIFPIVAQFAQIGSYFATRRTIRRGIPLWDRSLDEIKSKGLMGPWKLNLYESVLVSLPISAFIWSLDLIAPSVDKPTNIFGHLSKYELEVMRLSEKIFGLIDPFFIPMTLLIFTFVAGWSSLHSVDSSRHKMRRARHAYLYLDGSYGLIPQFLMVLIFTVPGELQARSLGNIDTVLTIATYLRYPISIWLIIVTWFVVPSKLFAINGYSSKIPFFFRNRNLKNHGPHGKYQFLLAIFSPVIIIILRVIVILMSGFIASFLAKITIPSV